MYNRKDYEEVRSGNKLFDFRQPKKGFPPKLSKKFLLVGLLNNLSKLTDNPEEVKANIKACLRLFDLENLQAISKWHGEIVQKNS